MIFRPPHSECDPERLGRLLRDELSEAEKAAAIGHLDRCEDCQRRIERLAAGSRWWDEVRSLDESGDEGEDAWGPGDELTLGFLDPPEKDGQIGRLGSYEVLQVIGRGGMGVVLKALDPALNRPVAIKVLAPHLAGTSAARRRFAREAKAAAAVGHEHVVTIHAVDTGGRLPYLVMQYVAGKSLQERIDQTGPLDTIDIVRIGMQAAAGLAAAHAQGLIHRDVKPSNILLEDGIERVKLTDFGLALAVDDASLTQSGLVAGTPQYMAPEQARGEPFDHRADLFSLGSVLYAMACGRPPFRASSTIAVLRRVSDEAPRSVREVNPDIPEWLAAIISRLHAMDPSDRFQSAAEVADLLGRWLAHLHSPQVAPRPDWPPEPAARRPLAHRRALAAGVIAMIAVIGLGGATGVAQQAIDKIATVLRIRFGDGVLTIRVDDPGVKVRLDGTEIVITDAGIREIRVRPGRHEVSAEKDGRPYPAQIIEVRRGDRTIVEISQEPLGADRPTSGPPAAGRMGPARAVPGRPPAALLGMAPPRAGAGAPAAPGAPGPVTPVEGAQPPVTIGPPGGVSVAPAPTSPGAAPAGPVPGPPGGIAPASPAPEHPSAIGPAPAAAPPVSPIDPFAAPAPGAVDPFAAPAPGAAPAGPVPMPARAIPPGDSPAPGNPGAIGHPAPAAAPSVSPADPFAAPAPVPVPGPAAEIPASAGAASSLPAPAPRPESSVVPGAGAAPRPERPGGGRPASIQGISRAVSSLVARIRENPARPSALEKERFGLFLLDIERSEVTKVADEPVRGLYYCGSPSWSRDGRRLVFDASPGAVFHQSHIVMIAPEGQRDLGVGACPSLSPDGAWIAFLLNPGAVPGGEWDRGVWEPGVYVMQADGTDRRWTGHHGRPRWSPNGGQLLICDFSKPCRVTVVNESGAALTINGLGAYSAPDWAGEDTIVAAIRRDPAGKDADTIALFDVSDPGLARMKEVLWRKGQGLDVTPSYPVYSPAARRCAFAGKDPQGMAIYGLDRDRDQARPVMLEPGQFDRTIQDLALSPDGRYVVFASDRNARPLHPAPATGPGGQGPFD